MFAPRFQSSPARVSMARPAAARVLALAVILLSALPASAQGTLYLCRMMQQVTSACCCGPVHELGYLDFLQEGETAAPKLEAADCCEVLPQVEHAPSPAVKTATLDVPPPCLAAVRFIPAVMTREPAPAPAGASVQARGPPSSSAPIFLENCALLI